MRGGIGQQTQRGGGGGEGKGEMQAKAHSNIGWHDAQDGGWVAQ